MKLVLTALFAIICGFQAALANPAAIVLVRHAEKPAGDEEGTELSTKGWARAKALPSFFNNRAEVKAFGAPVALFAMAPKNDDGSVRAIQTLKYMSQEFHLSINQRYTKKKAAELAAHIAADHSLDGKLVVICWNHDYIGDVARALGAGDAPDMNGDTFDRAWLLKYSSSGRVTFSNLPQRLLPGDSQH